MPEISLYKNWKKKPKIFLKGKLLKKNDADDLRRWLLAEEAKFSSHGKLLAEITKSLRKPRFFLAKKIKMQGDKKWKDKKINK